MSIHNFLSKNIYNIVIGSIFILFALLYWRTIMYLPLYGDATIHGLQSYYVSLGGWKLMSSDYPSFYYYIVASIEQIIGGDSYNLVVYFGIFFILFYSVRISELFAGNKRISLFILLFVGFSSKLIFYSGRLYQEILITAFFLITFYYLLKYIKNHFQKGIFITAFFVGITLSIKQQGLFILYPSIFIFLFFYTVGRKVKVKDTLIFLIIPIIIGVGFYGVLFHNKGRIIIGNEDFTALNVINYIGQDLFGYTGTDYKLNNLNDALNYANKEHIKETANEESITSGLEPELENIQKEYYSEGTTKAEERHVYFKDIFTYNKFNITHNLYAPYYGYLEYTNITTILFVFLFLGLFVHFKNDVIQKREVRYFIYMFIFLGINYFFFQRNTDQARYHLFIPFFLVPLLTIALGAFIKQKKNYISLFSILFIYLILVAFPFFNTMRGAINGQIYSPSRGGIPSIREAGEYLQNTLSPDEHFFQMCGNETSYYAKHTNIGDWRIYYLNNPDIFKYLQQNNLEYFVLFDSQIVPDDSWNNLCKIPESFIPKLNEVGDIIFDTSINDIHIYKIKESHEKNPLN